MGTSSGSQWQGSSCKDRSSGENEEIRGTQYDQRERAQITLATRNTFAYRLQAITSGFVLVSSDTRLIRA